METGTNTGGTERSSGLPFFCNGQPSASREGTESSSGIPSGLTSLLGQLDGDRLLILGLLVLLYKDGGGSKRLLLALAYLLMG